MFRGSDTGILVMRDYLILFTVKREVRKLFFVVHDQNFWRDLRSTQFIYR